MVSLKIVKKTKEITDLPERELVMFAGIITMVALDKKVITIKEVDEILEQVRSDILTQEAKGTKLRR